MNSKVLPPVPSALELLDSFFPALHHARGGGWVINVAMEWRAGERFTVSGELIPSTVSLPVPTPADVVYARPDAGAAGVAPAAWAAVELALAHRWRGRENAPSTADATRVIFEALLNAGYEVTRAVPE